VYVSLTTTKASPGEPTEIATIAGEEMLPWFSEIEGFEGLLMLSSEASGTTLALVFWDSEETAERHRTARMAFRDRVTAAANVEVVDTVGYEVTFAHLGSRLKQA
jgi:hypothetical protein